MLDRERAEEFAEWFRTLSDATRVQVLAWIAQHPDGVSVKRITAAFPQSQSTISHHLAALTSAGFVTVTRAGTGGTYRVNPACTEEMPDAVAIVTGTCCRDDTSATECCEPTASSDACCAPPATLTAETAALGTPLDIRDAVQERYAALAREAGGGCCAPTPLTRQEAFGQGLYGDDDAEGTTSAALSMSLGCGVPVTHADLLPGETVLDLGSGAGADVLIAAHKVGASGAAIGVDMTPEMIALATEHAEAAGVTNARFELGYLEDLPLPDDSVDVIISNCVLNLTADKPAALAEALRVLKPGGRLAISDVVLVGDLDDATRADVAEWTGCIAGALPVEEYRQILKSLGFGSVSVTTDHHVHESARSAMIRAVKPFPSPRP